MFTPFFTSIHKQKSLSAKEEELSILSLKEAQIIPQILSKDADEMLRFASFCYEKGHTEINWNLGCPYPRVANKKRGSGMLPYPEMVYQILEKVMGATPIKWSIKCRLGYLSPTEIFDLIPVFNQFNLEELIVHARIGKQLYKGHVDGETFQQLPALIRAPLVYNGDVFTTSDFLHFQKQYHLSHWMIGRGLLVDPFLPARIKKGALPSLYEQQEVIRRFIEDLYLSYRKKMNDRPQAISVLKELWGFMSYGFDHPQKIFNAIKKCKSFEQYEGAIASVFSKYKWGGSEAGLYHKNMGPE